MYATSPGVTANEIQQAGNERGAFTEALLDGLRGEGDAKVWDDVGQREYVVTWDSLFRYVEAQVARKRLAAGSRLIQVPRQSGEHGSENPELGRLDPEAFSATYGNPNGDTVTQLLKRLGIADPLRSIRPIFDRHWKKLECETFLKDKLDEIVNRRHRVAHSADALNIGRRDLRESLRFLRVLGKALDDATHRQVRATLRGRRRGTK